MVTWERGNPLHSCSSFVETYLDKSQRTSRHVWYTIVSGNCDFCWRRRPYFQIFWSETLCKTLPHNELPGKMMSLSETKDTLVCNTKEAFWQSKNGFEPTRTPNFLTSRHTLALLTSPPCWLETSQKHSFQVVKVIALLKSKCIIELSPPFLSAALAPYLDKSLFGCRDSGTQIPERQRI